MASTLARPPIADAAVFDGHLLDRETIVWWGQPVLGLSLSSKDWLQIPFSPLWCGFVIFWQAVVFRRQPQPAAVIPCAPQKFALREFFVGSRHGTARNSEV